MVKNLRNEGSIPGLGDTLEEEMATHSSILAWRIHGQRSLVGYSPWGHKESDMTEVDLAAAAAVLCKVASVVSDSLGPYGP